MGLAEVINRRPPFKSIHALVATMALPVSGVLGTLGPEAPVEWPLSLPPQVNPPEGI